MSDVIQPCGFKWHVRKVEGLRRIDLLDLTSLMNECVSIGSFSFFIF